ncbi:hypothetical protein Tco_1014933 [Tanacetum coccineum]
MLGRNGIWELMELADDGVRGLDEDEEFYSRTFHRPNSPLTNLHQHLEKIFQLLRRTFYFNLYVSIVGDANHKFISQPRNFVLKQKVDMNAKFVFLKLNQAFVFAVLGVILFGAAFGYCHKCNFLIESIADSTLQLAGVKATVLCAWFCRVSYLGNGGRTRSTNYMSELVISGGREFPYVVESIMKKSATITFGKEEIASIPSYGFTFSSKCHENLHGVNNSESEVVIEDVSIDATSLDESTTEDESSDKEQCLARHVGILDETPRGSKY